jgi:hypothetical protein
MPVALLAAGPLLLGVPHLVADVRYLVVRPRLQHDPVWRWAVLPLVLATSALGSSIPGLFAIGLAAIARWRATARGVLVLSAVAALCVVAWHFDRALLWTLGWAHNAVALFIWWRERPRNLAHWAGISVYVSVLAWICLGGADAQLVALLDQGAGGWFRIDDFALLAPPGWTSISVMRAIVGFAFMQSVHYAVWLRLMPEDCRVRSSTRSFRQSWRAARSDLGLLLPATLVLCAALVAFAALRPAAALSLYFSVALGHGFLEWAWLAAGAPRAPIGATPVTGHGHARSSS